MTTSFLVLGGAVCTVAQPVSLASENNSCEKAIEGNKSLPFYEFKCVNQNFSSAMTGSHRVIEQYQSGASAIMRLKNRVLRNTISPCDRSMDIIFPVICDKTFTGTEFIANMP